MSINPITPIFERVEYIPISSVVDYNSIWEIKTITELGWNESKVQPLLDYLELRSFDAYAEKYKTELLVKSKPKAFIYIYENIKTKFKPLNHF